MNPQDLLPYHITISKPYRQSSQKLFGSQSSMLQRTSQLANQTITTLLPKSYQQVYQGPQPNIKIVFTIRVVEGAVAESTATAGLYFYASLVVVDMDANVIQPYVVYERVDGMETKVRSAAVHPGGKEVVVLGEKEMQVFYISKLANKKKGYQLKLKSKYPITNIINNLKYSPTGTHLLALANYQKDIKLIKLQQLNNKLIITNSTTLNNKCVNSSGYTFMARQAIAIDKNRPSQAVVCLNWKDVCVVEVKGQELGVQVRGIERGNVMGKAGMDKIREDTGRVFSRLAVFNQTGNTVYVAYQPYQELGVMFDPTKNSSSSAFVYTSTRPYDSQTNTARCIQVGDIDSLACYNENKMNLYVTKIDRQNNITYELQKIQTFQQGQRFNIQSGFYNAKTSQLCVMLDQVITCYLVQGRCRDRGELVPVGQCWQACRSANKIWNPVIMTCQDCKQSCKCSNPKQSYSPYSQSCAIDCSKIAKAYPFSSYQFNTKCLCQHSFQWIDTSKHCQAICSNVTYSTGTNTNNPTQCSCQPNFTFREYNQTFFNPGQCILTCQNGQQPLYSNGTPYCKCSFFKQWNYSSNECIRLQSVFSLPIWAIILICVACFVVLALVLCCVFRCVRKRRLQKQGESRKQSIGSIPVTSRPISRNLQSGSDMYVDGYNKCVVCGEDAGRGVRAPCGHSFHQYCISKMIQSKKCECPECNSEIDRQLILKIQSKSNL